MDTDVLDLKIVTYFYVTLSILRDSDTKTNFLGGNV